MRMIFLALLFSGSLGAQVLGGNLQIGGNIQFGAPVASPIISSLSLSPSSSTIVATYSTQSISSTVLACGMTSGGPYTLSAVDNGTQSAVLSHQGIVAGLSASTTYYCQVQSANTSGTATTTSSVSTLTTQATTPATGVSFGAATAYNSINPSNQGGGDTYYNAKSSDGFLYFMQQDSNGPNGINGFQISGVPASKSGGSAISMVKAISESPFAAQTVNFMPAYGNCCTSTGDDGWNEKASGLFAMNNYLFISAARDGNTPLSGLPNPTYSDPQGKGQIIHDHADHGATWDNFQTPNTYLAGGNPTTPASATMFPLASPSIVSATFIMYAADDGTLGYLVSGNRHDDGDAYVYLITNEGAWNGGGPANAGKGSLTGDFYYLARVPRAKMVNLNPADYQWFKSGDGNLDANWSNTETDALPIVSAPGLTGNPSAQYFPALNRYILMGFDYPGGVGNFYPNPATASSVWTTWESPHPWGPWTIIDSTAWPTNGEYNPIIQTDTTYTGTAPTIMFTRNFGNNALYQLYFSTMTIAH